MSLRTPDPLYTHNYIATWRLQWDYFGSTLQQIALWVIQFARAAFWTQYRLWMWFCLVFCMPSCNRFAWLMTGWHKFYQQSWVQEQILCEHTWPHNYVVKYAHTKFVCSHTWPHYVVKYAHTKFVLVLKIVGKYSVHNMLQTRTYCTQLTRLVKLDLSVKD